MANFAAPQYEADGRVTTPAASAVIADTGAVQAGFYRVEAHLAFADAAAAGKLLHLEHRNAANTVTLHEAGCPAPGALQVVWAAVYLNDGERIRVVNGAVAGAASSVASAGIRLYRLP